MAKYRIVRDRYLGYEAQIWRWWWPFWVMIDYCNTHHSIEAARKHIQKHKQPVVEHVE